MSFLIRPQITQITQILTTKDTKGFTKDTKRVLNHRGRRGMKSVFRKSIPLGMHLSVENGASSLLSASRKKDVDVHTYQPWCKLLFSGFICLGLVFMVLEIVDKKMNSNACIFLLACMFGFAVFTILIWTTHIELIGTKLIARNIVWSRQIEINSMCKVLKVKEGYVIVDAKRKKIQLSFFLVGIGNLIERINTLIASCQDPQNMVNYGSESSYRKDML